MGARGPRRSGFLFAAALAYPKGMGMGDVKLALLLGAMLGRTVPVALMLGMFAALVPSLVLVARHGSRARKMGIPFRSVPGPRRRRGPLCRPLAPQTPTWPFNRLKGALGAADTSIEGSTMDTPERPNPYGTPPEPGDVGARSVEPESVEPEQRGAQPLGPPLPSFGSTPAPSSSPT